MVLDAARMKVASTPLTQRCFPVISTELTQLKALAILSAMEVSSGPEWISDKELVDSVLRDLAEAADRWEALVAQSETVTYSVDMGDMHAVADSDGKLVNLSLDPGITRRYSHNELAARMNTAFAALRAEVEDDYQSRYGGELR